MQVEDVLVEEKEDQEKQARCTKGRANEALHVLDRQGEIVKILKYRPASGLPS